MAQNFQTVLAPAYQQYGNGHAQAICHLLGIDFATDGPRVAKFVRCNGHVEILLAAAETRRRMVKVHGSQNPTHVADPWAYSVAVANGAWARSRELYLRLGLYERALRSRVQGLASAHLGNGWWQNPHLYMSTKNWQDMLRTNSNIRQFAPAGPNIPPMASFPTSDAFVAKLTLSELHDIVCFLWQPVFQFVLTPVGQTPTSFNKMKSQLWKLLKARNDVMHMRFITKAAYPDLLSTVERLLAAFEFDVGKAMAGIAAAPTV